MKHLKIEQILVSSMLCILTILLLTVNGLYFIAFAAGLFFIPIVLLYKEEIKDNLNFQNNFAFKFSFTMYSIFIFIIIATV